MFKPNAPALNISRIKLDNGGELAFEATDDSGEATRFVFTNAADLKKAIDAQTPTHLLLGYESEVAMMIAACDLALYENGFIYTPIGAIAIDAPALAAWIETAAPGQSWERHPIN